MNAPVPAFAFSPRKGETEWWHGDPERLSPLSAGEPHHHILVRPNTLSADQCRILIACFERNRETCATREGGAYWSGRYIWQNTLPRSEMDAVRIMQQARLLALLLLTQTLRPRLSLHSDTAQLVRWHEGIELTPHADNMEPDGSANATPHRAFSSLIYLNDDFEGGETFFPGHGVRLKPQTGALVLFGAGPEYVHGVTRIRRGMRYTYAGWFTYDPHRRDADSLRIF